MSNLMSVENCSICFELLSRSSSVYPIKTPCNHTFHNTCLNQHVAQQLLNYDTDNEDKVEVTELPTCPLCRGELKTSNANYSYSAFKHMWNIDRELLWVTVPDMYWFIGPYYGFDTKHAVDYSHRITTSMNENKFLSIKLPFDSWKLPLITAYHFSCSGPLGPRLIDQITRVVVNVNTQKMFYIIEH